MQYTRYTRTLASLGMLLPAALVFVACDSLTGPRSNKPEHLELVSPDTVVAVPEGTPVTVTVRVLGRNDAPLAGVPVAFEVPPGGGQVDSATAHTDAAGIARTVWHTAGPVDAMMWLTVTVDGVPSVQQGVRVLQRPPVRLVRWAYDSLTSEVAGRAQRPGVYVMGAGNLPLNGIPVHFEVSGAGTVDSAIARTGPDGLARAYWYPPTTADSVYWLTMRVEGLPPVRQGVRVTAGPTARREIDPDSLVFHTYGREQLVSARAYDQFGNRKPFRLETSDPGTLRIRTVDDSTWAVWAQKARGLRELLLVEPFTGAAPISFPVRIDPVVVRVGFSSPIDSITGIVVGQQVQFQLAAFDSGGNRVTGVQFAEFGIDVRSSDPSVLQVDGTGLVTGVQGGTARLLVSGAGLDTSWRIPVLPRLDLGTRQKLRVLFPPTTYTRILRMSFDAQGVTYMLERNSHSTARHETFFTDNWSRTFGYNSTVTTTPDGSGFIHDPVTAAIVKLDASGTELWRMASPGSGPAVLLRPLADGGVLVLRGDTLAALGAGGERRWFAAVPGEPANVIVAPERIFLATAAELRAFDLQGTLLWTRTLGGGPGLQTEIADRNSAVYVYRSGTLTSFDMAGTHRWSTAATVSVMVLGQDDRLLAIGAGNDRVVRSVSRTTGVQHWVASIGAVWTLGVTPWLGATSNGLVLLREWGGHLHGFDAATGAFLGRTEDRGGEHATGIIQGRIMTDEGYGIYSYTVPFGPGSEWSQNGGNAARSYRVAVP